MLPYDFVIVFYLGLIRYVCAARCCGVTRMALSGCFFKLFVILSVTHPGEPESSFLFQVVIVLVKLE